MGNRERKKRSLWIFGTLKNSLTQAKKPNTTDLNLLGAWPESDSWHWAIHAIHIACLTIEAKANNFSIPNFTVCRSVPYHSAQGLIWCEFQDCECPPCQCHDANTDWTTRNRNQVREKKEEQEKVTKVTKAPKYPYNVHKLLGASQEYVKVIARIYAYTLSNKHT